MSFLPRKGMFGTIQAVDTNGVRHLQLNGQIQGAAYLEPDASILAPGLRGPGPMASSTYMTGWLLAGSQHPQASMLMVGLGSGAGAIQLLTVCPEVDITVVEIDPVMVDAATEAFPLLTYYQNQGRLNIVVEDATTYVESDGPFEVALADAYDGITGALKDSYLPTLLARSGAVYLNCIDYLDGRAAMAIAELAAAFGKPLTQRLYASRFPPGEHPQANWILSTDQIDLSSAAMLEPFAELPESAAKQDVATNYIALLSQLQP